METAAQKSTKSNIRGDLARRLAARRTRNSALRMTPMIDMIFLLLVFFLLTAEFRPPRMYLPFVLPRAGADLVPAHLIPPLVLRLDQHDELVTIAMGGEGSVKVAAETIERDLLGFADALARAMESAGRTTDDPFEIIASADLEWQYLASVYDILFGMGVTNITFRMTE